MMRFRVVASRCKFRQFCDVVFIQSLPLKMYVGKVPPIYGLTGNAFILDDMFRPGDQRVPVLFQREV